MMGLPSQDIIDESVAPQSTWTRLYSHNEWTGDNQVTAEVEATPFLKLLVYRYFDVHICFFVGINININRNVFRFLQIC